MKKNLAFLPAVIAIFVLCAPSQKVTRSVSPEPQGAYRFVSEKTEVTGPHPGTFVRTSPDWKGFFFFDDGRFSVNLENSARSGDWHTQFPKNLKELGFQSIVGRFEVIGSELLLWPEIALNPYYDSRPLRLTFVADEDRLILTEILVPYTENKTQGTRTTILQKVDSRAK